MQRNLTPLFLFHSMMELRRVAGAVAEWPDAAPGEQVCGWLPFCLCASGTTCCSATQKPELVQFIESLPQPRDLRGPQ